MNRHGSELLTLMLEVPIHVKCQFAVLGEVSHVKEDGGLQDFPGAADVIHWNEGKGLDQLERSSDVRAQYFVLRDKVEAGEVPP